MPRTARMISESAFYHVIERGIGKQILFEEDHDYRFYLSILERFSIETSIVICAYCLMENHVHLLIFDRDQNLSLMMKKIGISYSRYFNRKYERTGHLFQDRFLSESVESNSALLIVFRYILRNPQKAGICHPGDYKWSSYHAYACHDTFVDTSSIEMLIGTQEKYIEFVNNNNTDDCDNPCFLDYKPVKKDDKWALGVINEQLAGKSGTILQNCPRRERDAALKKLKNAGLSIRQLERLTGINRGVIQKA